MHTIDCPTVLWFSTTRHITEDLLNMISEVTIPFFPLSEQTLVERTYNNLTHILVFESQCLPVGLHPLPTLLSLNLTQIYV